MSCSYVLQIQDIMKILINAPSFKILGGVARHYLGLNDYWSENVRFNAIGNRNIVPGHGIFWVPCDIVKFMARLLTFRPDVIVVNPSLGANALWRDFLFMNIAQAMGFKVIIFLHGFDFDYAKKINKNWAVKNFNKASLIFVLARRFKDIMQGWGVTTPIRLTTTKVDDKLVKGFDIVKERDFTKRNILFLSRLENAKGIYEAVDTYAILKQKYSDITLSFVGDGTESDALKQYVADKGLQDVRFTGRLSGEALVNEYKAANFFLFSSHGEGMPAAVLEAMAFGLPVFTRTVGGLVDFFENDKMGYITDSLDPKDFAAAMVPYLESPELTKQVSLYNAEYAKKHFMASSVARQIENTIKETIGI